MSQNLTAPVLVLVDPDAPTGAAPVIEIGRASCRERV